MVSLMEPDDLPQPWLLSNYEALDFALVRFSPDGAYPWGLWGPGTGRATAYEENLRQTLAGRISENPNLVSLPIRLYNPECRISIWTQHCDPVPDYVVISYTWGRWMSKDRSEDTTIEGGYWRAPANDRFSREDLDTAVERIAAGMHAWVDVFCIPQNDNDSLKSVEIGKQPAIFRSASRAAVWLGTGGGDTVVEVCSWVPEVMHMVSPVIFELPSKFAPTAHMPGNGRHEETWRRVGVLASFTDKVLWCSSLWTLQEAALRPDAIFYDKAGKELLHQSSGNPITIRHLRNTMKIILEELGDAVDWQDGQSVFDNPALWRDFGISETDVSLLRRATDTIKEVSLHKLGTMNASELLIASGHRTASREHDRVYGIMGAIGVEMLMDYTLDATEVMRRFLLKLHQVLPVEVQGFCREKKHPIESSQWLMTEEDILMTVLRQRDPPNPPVFLNVTESGELVACRIARLGRRGLAELKGKILAKWIVLASDQHVFLSFLDVKQGGHHTSPCLFLARIAQHHQLCLIDLGAVGGVEHMGLHHAYLLAASDSASGTQDLGVKLPLYRRLGFLLVAETFRFAESVEEEILIK